MKLSVKKNKSASYSNLKPGQQATLFPSLAFYDAKREAWRALVHGRVYKDGRIPFGTRLLLRGLKKAMKATPEDVASETFQQRVDGFLTAPGKRRKIVLDISGQRFRLKRRTRRNGAFYGTLSLPAEASTHATNGNSTISMSLLRKGERPGSSSQAQGDIHIVPPQGISVISDIDDTIKLTEATSRSKMLTNTFLRPFEVVEGMSQLYQTWKEQGCDFHYVSSSPWQLYGPLAELCQQSNFPVGSMHLKYFRVRDEMFKRFRPIRRNSKVGIIAGILKRLPDRQFVLVGDSGEKDPEIYRFLARRFPKQIRAVLIRNLDTRPLDADRLRKLGAIPSNTLLRVFTQTQQIEKIISETKETAAGN